MRYLWLMPVFMIVGLALGVWSAQGEFKSDILPTKIYLEYGSDGNGQVGRPKMPKIVVTNGEVFNFGTMQLLTKQTHDFVLRNDGDSLLTLEAGETSCKCTMSELKKTELQPGESTTITLSWTPKDTNLKFQQSANLLTNDPQRSRISLRIMGDVINTVWYEPREISIANMTAGEESNIKVKVFSSLDPSFALVSHSWKKEDATGIVPFEVELSPLPADEISQQKGATAGYLVNLRSKPGLVPGKFIQHLLLACNQAGVAPIEIPLRGTVTGDIGFIGPRVSTESGVLGWGVVEQGVGGKATIYMTVKGPNRETIQVKLVEAEPSDRLKVELGPVATDNLKVFRYPLTIEIPPDAPSGSFMGGSGAPVGRIVLETTHPTIKRIELKVTFLVK